MHRYDRRYKGRNNLHARKWFIRATADRVKLTPKLIAQLKKRTVPEYCFDKSGKIVWIRCAAMATALLKRYNEKQ